MTHEEATMAVEAMTALPFFPSAGAAQALVADELMRMCQTGERAMWLVRRMTQLFTKWPGIREMRAVYCSKFATKDGVECYSEMFLDGIPSERDTPLQISGSPTLALPAGNSVSVDPELEKQVADLAEARAMAPLPKYYARTPDEIRVDAELRQLFKL